MPKDIVKLNKRDIKNKHSMNCSSINNRKYGTDIQAQDIRVVRAVRKHQ